MCWTSNEGRLGASSLFCRCVLDQGVYGADWRPTIFSAGMGWTGYELGLEAYLPASPADIFPVPLRVSSLQLHTVSGRGHDAITPAHVWEPFLAQALKLWHLTLCRKRTPEPYTLHVAHP